MRSVKKEETKDENGLSPGQMDVIGILNTQAATDKITIENTHAIEAQ